MSKAPFFLSSSPSFGRMAALAAAACVVAASAAASAFAQQAGSARTFDGPLPTSSTDRLAIASVTDGPLDGSFANLPVSNAPAPSLDLARSAGLIYSSSASPALDAVDASAAANLDLPGLPADSTQPPPRRRYGRPRYNDNNHNADGSNKYAFIAGVGLTLATGNTYHYLNTSYSYQVGAGRNFNKNFSVIAQFDWDNFGFNGRTLGNQLYLENYYFNLYCSNPVNAGSATCQSGALGALDGHTHVWSFSINPVYNIYTREGFGAYVVAGVGFYHKVATFTTPEQGVYFDPYYGYVSYVANATVDHYSSNAPGFNAGFGLTFKPSRFSGQRLYAEARYVFVDNSQRTGVTALTPSATLNAYNGNNLYPANSNRTTYVPIKVGIRF